MPVNCQPMPNTAESSESKNRAPNASEGSSPPSPTIFQERRICPVRFRLVRAKDKKHTNPYGKLPHYHGVCHWAAHRPQVKPLKTKTLDVDIKAETPKSRYSVTFSDIFGHFLENLYTPTANLFCFNHSTSPPPPTLRCKRKSWVTGRLDRRDTGAEWSRSARSSSLLFG